MDKTWIVENKKNTTCILFFNGWGMDANAINHLDTGNYNICMFNNYQTFNAIDNVLIGYNNIYVVAWSLGVWVAAKILSQSNIRIEKSIAVNGTLKPIDAKKGIPEAVFNTTLENWDEKNRNKFNMRVFGGRNSTQNLSDKLPNRPVSEQKTELMKIKEAFEASAPVTWKFDRAIIGQNDLIFSAENQNSFWNNKTNTIIIDNPHYPFGRMQSWNELIEL